ncbi:MAG: RnfABCDGE type electron transport complex subunit D, partial [Xanthomonadales bacterium]|nr:RnfABCDGE type electron transport complex subunit D [Xanthomonadales bacterium]
MNEPTVRITAAPHVRSAESTARIMWSVVLSLVPVIGASIWFFGLSALLVLLAAVAGCLVTERLFGDRRDSLADGSAMITGLLLGLCLPAGFPLWMAFLGGVFGIGFGKLVFGGLGQNIFNPALLGRAFLQAAFPVAITTWPVRSADWVALRGDNFALPFMTSSPVDTLTGATPLGELKFGDDPVIAPLLDLFLG